MACPPASLARGQIHWVQRKAEQIVVQHRTTHGSLVHRQLCSGCCQQQLEVLGSARPHAHAGQHLHGRHGSIGGPVHRQAARQRVVGEVEGGQALPAALGALHSTQGLGVLAQP